MILYGMLVPVAVWQVRLRSAVSVYFTTLNYPHILSKEAFAICDKADD